MIKIKTLDQRPGPRIVVGNIGPARPAGWVASARALAENVNTDWNYLAGVCRPISGDNTHPAANQNTSIPPDRGINNMIHEL